MRAIVRKLKPKLKPTDTVERCGFVLQDGRAFQCENEHPDPSKGFMIPVAMLVDNEDMLLGTWHTHPNQSAALSQEDYIGFSQWPELTHFIIGTDGVRAYRVIDGFITEVDTCS